MASLFDADEFKRRRAAKRAPGAPGAPSAPQALTVSALAASIDSALRAGFPNPVRVIGEVSGFRDRTHWYFDLKDIAAVVNCVMFQSAAKRAKFTPSNGQEVVVSGRVEFYAKAGKVSLLVDRIEPVGAGALELAYQKLLEEIRALGWFDAARKRPLPAFPRRIGVVTSRSAAALQDVLVTMKRRCPAVGVLLADVRVQGEGAAEEIARAIGTLGRRHKSLGIDAVLVTRGGGSMEDLWAFNEKIVAEAIVNCRVPVVAAIGHETDTTIAELVADERCATPTQAAVRLTPDGPALLRQLDSTGRRLRALAERRVAGVEKELRSMGRHLAGAMDARRQRLAGALDRAAFRLERSRPQAVHARLISRLDGAASRLHSAARHALQRPDLDGVAARLERGAGLLVRRDGAQLDAMERQLQAVSPLRVLERGFSVTSRAGGGIVRAPSDVRPGDRIATRLAEGSIDSVVTDGSTPPTPTPPTARPTRTRAPRRPQADQPGLF